MSNIIIRTRNPKTEGGNLDDVQISFVVEAIDEETGQVLYGNHLWLSAKGVGNDPENAAAISQIAAAQWADENAEYITAEVDKLDVKAPEREAVADLLTAISETPDIVYPRDDLRAVIEAKAQAQAELDAATIDDDEPVIVGGERVG